MSSGHRSSAPKGHRVVPDLASSSPSTAASFYERIFGFETVMDQGWIVTLADPDRPSVQ